MILYHISPNRHSWNLRRVEELQLEIAKKEKQLQKTHSFFERIKLNKQLKNLSKRQIQHGEEVLEYELRQQNGN